ncbi:uncharacterized protein Dwil_GK25466 [Drosophila willistoni]|uniref:Uncharacterized protein n=2 Tax=Drosophila willistoni TaxID=7260 RepID=B4NDK6_DROWI|nr:uncharacterized protein Dwil_GK25466 [Drosophila willistoni]
MAAKNKTVRLIKCFCGCSDMTVEEVHRIYTLTIVSETLLDVPDTKLLARFMELRRFGNKNDAEQYLEIYEKYAELIMEEKRTFTQDKVDELVDLGLPYDLEQDLSRRLLSGQQREISLRLYQLQGKCRNEIEASNDFRRVPE